MHAFILGNPSERVAKQVIEASDIQRITPYVDVNEFLNRATRQNLRYERIVLLAQIIKSENDLRGIRDYLQTSNLPTQVIIIARSWEPKDIQILDLYYNYFRIPIYTDYTLNQEDSVDVGLLMYVLTESIDNIRMTKSSLKDVTPNVRSKKEYNANEENKFQLRHCHANDGVIKSFSYGGKIWGRNKLTKTELAQVERVWSQARAIVGQQTVR